MLSRAILGEGEERDNLLAFSNVDEKETVVLRSVGYSRAYGPARLNA